MNPKKERELMLHLLNTPILRTEKVVDKIRDVKINANKSRLNKIGR